MEFSYRTRQQNLKKLYRDTFDLVILGGGINGVAVTRDAVSRGLKTALIEACDYSSATSSASSKLIHGGLRYLEQLRIFLTFESLKEKNFLLKSSPHLVKPLDFVFPIYKGDRLSSFHLQAGLFLYNLLSGFKNKCERLSHKDVLKLFPLLKIEGLKTSFCYEDAQMDDAGLTFEVLLSAHRKGSICVNYVRALKCFSDRVLAKDTINNETFEIKTRHIVSTLGPWTDIFSSQNNMSWKPILSLRKGVHLVFSQNDLPSKKALVFQKDKRIIFVIPQARNKVLVGTTDTAFKGDPRTVCVTKNDIDYLFSALKTYFPQFEASYGKIVSCFAGVRPLAKQFYLKETQISRKEKIIRKDNITFVIGGKYTTFRPIAKKVLNFVTHKKYLLKDEPLRELDFSQNLQDKTHFSTFSTKEQCFQKVPQADYHFITKRFSHLYKHLDDEKKAWALLAHYALERTMCLSLKDFFRLRTDLTLFEPQKAYELIDFIASIFEKEMKWSKKEMLQQKKEALNSLTFCRPCF